MQEHDPFADLDAESRVYIGLHNAMMHLFQQGNHRECLRLAAQLLTFAALPHLIRARCHMMLSLRMNSAQSVTHAEQAVEIIDNQVRAAVSPEEFPQDQLDIARSMLREARERAEARTQVTDESKDKTDDQSGGPGADAASSSA
ncbi:Hypothetical protein D9617_32g092230 [Elsinoe fawcettii]|nr:Hypothetical protein D9617_32g092230 [Elsinoe fawcettii]